MSYLVTQKRVYGSATISTFEQPCNTRAEAMALARRLGAPVRRPYAMLPGVKVVSVAATDGDVDIVTRIVEL